MNTEVMCRDGYTVGGSGKGASTFNVRCTSEGVFEKYDARNCEPVRCGPPPAMPNATLLKVKSPNGRLSGKNDGGAKNLEACIGECDSDAQCKSIEVFPTYWSRACSWLHRKWEEGLGLLLRPNWINSAEW